MGKKKTYDARDVATVTTGIVLKTPFIGPEVVSHVLGYPVWTHELPEARRKAVPLIQAQWPECPTDAPEDWRALADDLTTRFPDGVTLTAGAEKRSADPLTTLAEKTDPDRIIVVESPDHAR